MGRNATYDFDYFRAKLLSDYCCREAEFPIENWKIALSVHLAVKPIDDAKIPDHVKSTLRDTSHYIVSRSSLEFGCKFLRRSVPLQS